jgi:hypothetical protein
MHAVAHAVAVANVAHPTWHILHTIYYTMLCTYIQVYLCIICICIYVYALHDILYHAIYICIGIYVHSMYMNTCMITLPLTVSSLLFNIFQSTCYSILFCFQLHHWPLSYCKGLNSLCMYYFCFFNFSVQLIKLSCMFSF